jgi:ADP-ribosylglycohydrolase
VRDDRRLGALLGVHAGDSLGATLEFMTWPRVMAAYPDGLRDIVGGGQLGWPVGHATDDTDLTRAVLLGYADPRPDLLHAIADRMLDWYDGRWPDRTEGSHPVDVGGATRTALSTYARTGDPRTSGAGPGQAGNGSLMRAAPTGVLVDDRERRIADALAISAITHDDPRCTVSCAAYVEMVAALVTGVDARQAVDLGLAVADELGSSPVRDAIAFGAAMSLRRSASTGATGLAGDGGGFVLESLSIAVAAVIDDRSLEDVLVDVVTLGHDADTNGAIAGGLLGARDGAAAIPQRWLSVLQLADELASLLDAWDAR